MEKNLDMSINKAIRKKLDSVIQSYLNLYFNVETWEELKQHSEVISEESNIPDLVIYNSSFNKNDCFFYKPAVSSFTKFPRKKFTLQPKEIKEYNPFSTLPEEEKIQRENMNILEAYNENKRQVKDNYKYNLFIKRVRENIAYNNYILYNSYNSFLTQKNYYDYQKIKDNKNKFNMITENNEKLNKDRESKSNLEIKKESSSGISFTLTRGTSDTTALTEIKEEEDNSKLGDYIIVENNKGVDSKEKSTKEAKNLKCFYSFPSDNLLHIIERNNKKSNNKEQKNENIKDKDSNPYYWKIITKENSKIGKTSMCFKDNFSSKQLYYLLKATKENNGEEKLKDFAIQDAFEGMLFQADEAYNIFAEYFEANASNNENDKK